MSLFKTIDDLFEGLVFFFYNLFATLLRVLLSPVRGPQWLVRAHAKPKMRQVSSRTALFAALLCTLGAFGYFENRRGAAADAAKLLSSLPEFAGPAWWPYLLTALAVTVFVDLALRVVLLLFLRHRPHRREITISSVEYAFLWPCALACAFVILVWFGDGGSDLQQSIPFALALLGPIPPILHLARGIRIGFRSRRRSRRPVLRWAGSLAFSALATTGMTIVGGILLATTFKAARRQQIADGTPRPLEVTAIKCTKRNRAIMVTVILANPNAKPASIDGERLQLAIGDVMMTGVTPEGLFNLHGLDSTIALVAPDGSSVATVPANGALRLSGSTRRNSGAKDWHGDSCALAAGTQHDDTVGIYVPSQATNGVKWAVVETAPFVPWDRRNLDRDIGWAPPLTDDERQARAPVQVIGTEGAANPGR